MDFSKFEFLYGKAYSDCNVYIFKTDNGDKLYISEKVGKFQTGSISNYLLFEIENEGTTTRQYIDRSSEEYQEMNNIRTIVENYCNITVQCKGCNTIILKEQLTNAKGDKCVFCDMYICKKCKKFFPLKDLNDNRLCEKCRNKGA